MVSEIAGTADNINKAICSPASAVSVPRFLLVLVHTLYTLREFKSRCQPRTTRGQVSRATVPPHSTPDTTLSTSLSTAFIEWDQQPAAVVWLRCCPAPPLPTNNNNCEFDLQRCVRVCSEHYRQHSRPVTLATTATPPP